ncbi:MAG: ATP-dependent DNA helicase RecG [Clostridiaceae bacterium]|nr:ATP-dependent DNA helicase RecG [Clostridiaceae bacterium]
MNQPAEANPKDHGASSAVGICPPAQSDLFKRPVTDLPGVAGRRAAMLHKLGIETWFDLLCCFPRDFEDWSSQTSLAGLQDGQDQAFIARVARKPSLTRKGRLSILRTVLRADPEAISAIWFNQPYLADRLTVDNWYRFYGRIRRDSRSFSVQNPAFEPLDKTDPGDLKPVYPLTEGLSQGVIRQLIQTVLPQLIGCLPEPLPAWIRRDQHLCAVDYAYSRIHHPANREEIELCRERLVFEELFLMQTGLYLLRRRRKQAVVGVPLCLGAAEMQQMDRFTAKLPFRLTDAQQRVWSEIQSDLQTEQPMSRLLQGDVGSGKTVVAALAMLQCALCGSQAVLMAPTAILARQHFQTLNRLLTGTGFTVALLTGATPLHERKILLAGLADGEIKLLVGTHALIEDQVRFAGLALAITDEQHRFGVRQRIRLGSAAAEDAPSGQPAGEPHVLVMSATPIPRSLALILYGDLDLSIIDQLPAGRRPIETYTAADADRARIERLMRRFVQEGRQVYVVCPMIEEQSKTDLESAIKTFNRLSQEVFPDLHLGLLHGSLKQKAKDLVMDEFMAGTVQILVSTTVIEVGVDNPNAALMVIENAERFGLAQLHQLRGRIGRGEYRSVCVLLSDAEDERARERLRTLCHAADGLTVAEKDLELRGPGDFFGTRQHGLPALRIANLYRDSLILKRVQNCLLQLAERDPDLRLPEHQAARRALLARFGEAFANIGL